MVKPLRNRRARGVVFALAALALVITGYRLFRWYRVRNTLEWSGTIEARFANVGSRKGGRVRDVLVREGDRVGTGAPMIVLEAVDLEAQRAQAEGQVVESQATLDRLKAGSRPEEITQSRARVAQAQAAFEQVRKGARSEDIAAARARFSAALAKANNAIVEAERARRLAAQQAISHVELDNAETSMQSAISERDAQRNALDELLRGNRPEEIEQAEARAWEARAAEHLVENGSRAEDIRAAQGRLIAAKGRLNEIVADLNELTIRAPQAARVEALDLRPGDILAANAAAVRLLEPDQLFVRVYVPETQLGYIRPGQHVLTSVDTFPDRVFKGVVESVSNEGEFTPRNLQTVDERANQVFATRVRIEEGKDVLRAGMAAIVRVHR